MSIRFGPSDIDAIAHAIIRSVCVAEAEDALRQALIQARSEKSAIPHAVFFDVEFKRLAPYEARWKAMLRAIWAEEERIILANLKKLKKGRAAKGLADNVMYPQTPFANKLSKATRKLLAAMMADLGPEKLSEIDAHIQFDVSNPHVQEWLDDYSFKFSAKLEEVNGDKLRAILEDGMEAGKTIPELMSDIRGAFDNMSRYRSEIIARTETSRASNQAAFEAYAQSGVVEKKEWLTAPDCCDICAELDGVVVPLEDEFFDDDYGDGMAPPRHPSCRCACAAHIE